MSSINSSELLDLPVPERLRLVTALWDSISEDPDSFGFTESERTELDKRMEAYLNNPTEGTSWSDIKSKMLSR